MCFLIYIDHEFGGANVINPSDEAEEEHKSYIVSGVISGDCSLNLSSFANISGVLLS